jgi:hypothetical protein
MAGRLTLYMPEDLAEEPPALRPLVRGVATCGTFGPFGGKQKTLKSICVFGLGLAVASGKPAFGFERWSVPEAKPVVIFAGEGGINLARRRLQRIAREIYDIHDLAELPLYVFEGVAEMNSDGFADALADAAKRVEKAHGTPPALVILDALYNFHDSDIEASNIYNRGRMLSDFQRKVHELAGEDCVLWVVDHFRKSAKDLGLDEYQQSGMGAWADSWWNAEHREEPDLTNQCFRLNVEIGSRQGYAGLYEIDIDLGPFDEERTDWARPMTVDIRRVHEHRRRSSGDGLSNNDIEREIFELVDNGDGPYTKTQIKELVSAGNDRVRKVLNELIGAKQLAVREEVRNEDGRRRARQVVERQGKFRVPATRPGNPAR